MTLKETKRTQTIKTRHHLIGYKPRRKVAEMASFKISTVVMMVVILFMSTTTTKTEAQDLLTCAQKLIPCQAYLNTTTTPSADCCSNISEAVKNELTCLCSLYKDPTLLQSFNVNVTQAIQVARRCNINTDLSNCDKGIANLSRFKCVYFICFSIVVSALLIDEIELICLVMYGLVW